ncbi:MAG: Ig-like domain-containing protein, partial [Minisyncoccales bacterium]
LSGGKTGIRFNGWGLPNAYVTLFIFSSPVIVVVKTDDQGRWTYTLDKPLDDGQHSVYAAQTDSAGRIEARSEVLVFAKNGDIVAKAVANQGEEVLATGRLKNNFSLAVAVAVAFALSAALFIIGAVAARARKGEQ